MSKIVMTKQEFANLIHAKAAQEVVESLVKLVDEMVGQDDFKPEIFLPVLLGIFSNLTDDYNKEVAKHIKEEDAGFAIEDICIKDE